MDETFKNKIELLIYDAINMIRQYAPKDTGNLAYNSIILRRIDDNTWKILVDESIAPYMPYTNEPWISTRWNRKKNPNEGWWNRIAKIVTDMLSEEINATVKEG